MFEVVQSLSNSNLFLLAFSALIFDLPRYTLSLVWLAVFLSAERLQEKLGPQVMTAFERLMGLILSAMAVEMFLAGIREFVKSL